MSDTIISRATALTGQSTPRGRHRAPEPRPSRAAALRALWRHLDTRLRQPAVDVDRATRRIAGAWARVSMKQETR